MSVILNALRQQNKQAESSVKGILWSQSKTTKVARIPWRIIGLGVLVFSLGFGTVMFSTSYIKTRVVDQMPKADTHPPAIPVQPSVPSETLAAQAFERGDFAGSIAFFNEAISKNPNDWALLNNLGLALFKTERLEEAESAFFKAIAINTGCASCYNNLGDLEAKRGSLDEAELYYQKAAKADLSDPAPYFNLGVLYEKKGDLDAAFEAYSQFLERNPNSKSLMAKKVQARLKNLEIEE
jgi:Flp pilus assembly protein TadD